MIEVRETAAYADWFAGLRDLKAQARVLVRIRRLALGNAGDAKPVGEGVGDKSSQQRDIRAALALAKSV